MYRFTHGESQVQVERFVDKRTGRLVLRGKVLYEESRTVYRKRRTIEAGQSVSSYQFSCELLQDIAASDAYTYNDRRWAVVLLRLITIDNRKSFESDEVYREFHLGITDLSYLVDQSWRFEDHPLDNDLNLVYDSQVTED